MQIALLANKLWNRIERTDQVYFSLVMVHSLYTNHSLWTTHKYELPSGWKDEWNAEGGLDNQPSLIESIRLPSTSWLTQRKDSSYVKSKLWMQMLDNIHGASFKKGLSTSTIMAVTACHLLYIWSTRAFHLLICLASSCNFYHYIALYFLTTQWLSNWFVLSGGYSCQHSRDHWSDCLFLHILQYKCSKISSSTKFLANLGTQVIVHEEKDMQHTGPSIKCLTFATPELTCWCNCLCPKSLL